MNEQVKQFIDQATQLLQNGQFAEALSFLDQAAQLDPNEAETAILRGVALAQLQRSQEATTAFREAIRLSPTNPKAFFNLGVHLHAQGQTVEAREMAQAALRYEPGHQGAKELLNQLDGPRQSPTEPPITGGSAYATPPMGSPYGPTPPPDGMYYRPGYQEMHPVHSLPWVEKLGSTWTMIGVMIVVIFACLSVYGLFASWPILNEMIANLNNPEKIKEISEKFQSGTGGGVLTYLSYGSFVFTWVWMIIDILDRKANWLWLIPMAICCCCGFPWASMGIYMAAGRK